LHTVSKRDWSADVCSSDLGVDPDVVRLVPRAERDAAYALVQLPNLIPLVILRGSGDTTRSLARHAATNGVGTLAHADGGAVLYRSEERRGGRRGVVTDWHA